MPKMIPIGCFLRFTCVKNVASVKKCGCELSRRPPSVLELGRRHRVTASRAAVRVPSWACRDKQRNASQRKTVQRRATNTISVDTKKQRCPGVHCGRAWYRVDCCFLVPHAIYTTVTMGRNRAASTASTRSGEPPVQVGMEGRERH